MLVINIRALALLFFVLFVVYFGMPVWVQIAVWLAELPLVRAGLVGFIIGVALRANWAWNMALRHRRRQAIEKADREYAQDRRRVV